MEFEWGDEKAARNLAKHGVAFHDAATVFGDPRAMTYYDPDHSLDEDRYLTFGHTSDGQLLVVSHTDARNESESSACDGPHAERESPMKKDSQHYDEDDIRPEYELSQLQGGVRGKYFDRYRAGTNLALLAPEVRAAFPTDAAVNEALRSLMQGQSLA